MPPTPKPTNPPKATLAGKSMTIDERLKQFEQERKERIKQLDAETDQITRELHQGKR